MHLLKGMACLLLCGLPLALQAQQDTPLPEPLTLEYALSLASETHPDVLMNEAAQARALAQRDASRAETSLNASVEGQLRWVGPRREDPDSITDDHRLSLFLRKPLYDFGRSSASLDAADHSIRGSELRYQALLDQRRLQIMEAYFAVLLADMGYDRDMEAMAMAYIRLDRLRNRHELGQASDIELLELERDYDVSRHQLSRSSNEQRASRARLANLLNRPGQLPSSLSRPRLDSQGRELPELDALYQQALQNNPRILALEAELSAANRRVRAAGNDARPRLDGELEASHYSRELGSSDRWRAGVYLTVPIYSGGRVDAGVAHERAALYEVQARLERERYELRQQVLETWLALQSLQLERQRALSEQSFRDLYLDRSRANYEMEVRSDLGDSMVRLSESQLALAQVNYDLALAWERLALLLGQQGAPHH